MNHQMRAGITEALRLTRAGRLVEATAAIQHSLGGLAARTRPSDAASVGAEPVRATYSDVREGPLAAETPEGDAVERRAVGAVPERVRPELEAGRHTSRHRPPSGLDASRPTNVASRLARATASIRRTLDGALPKVTGPLATPPEASSPGVRAVPGIAPAPAESGPTLAPESVAGGFEPRGRLVDGSYTDSAGTRAYKLYVPSGYAGQAVPLVVMLHGCTQTAADCAAGTRLSLLAEEGTFLVVYPEQAATANSSRCWSWFKAADQDRGRGEPSLIAGITRRVMAAYHIDARRVYVAGLSAGGAMAAIMGAAYPDLYAAVGVHSGLAPGAARNLPSALVAMRQGGPDPARRGGRVVPDSVPTIVFHGDRDTTVNPRNGQHVLARALLLGTGDGRSAAHGADQSASVSSGQVPDGRAYTRSLYRDANGHVVGEHWVVHGAGHAWSGGSPAGSFTEPRGPDASREMLRFFLEHPKPEPAFRPAD